jgi:hypothetical protein
VSRSALGFIQTIMERVPEAFSSGVKWPGRDADHSPPSGYEVKNSGTIPPLPHVPS